MSKTTDNPPQPRTPPALTGLALEIALLFRAENADPFHVLGPHVVERDSATRVVIRILQPHAAEVTVNFRGQALRAERIHPDGLFEALLPDGTTQRPAPGDYTLRFTWPGGATTETEDPYAFGPVLTDYDVHLFAEGTHLRTYEKMGAHLREVNGVRGVHWAVWAPNARRVSVVGDFNGWDGRIHPMRSCGNSGLWELFLPREGEGVIYKFEIRSKLGPLPFLKADPYAFAAELRPKTGSVVAALDHHAWQDMEWMKSRTRRDWLAEPMCIYEVHLGSWRRVPEEANRWLTYRELAASMIPYVKQLGYTHIELMPIMEHPYDASWGYQTVGYFAPTCRYGSPADFMYFVDCCHQAGIGVLLDWTPAHFPSDAHGLAEFDGTHLYEHADPKQGRHPDWGTNVFNYGRSEVQNFLIANVLFWLEKYHVDGLRVDAVASMLYLDYSRGPGEWVPNEFGGRENLAAVALLKRLNEIVPAQYPGALMIAEESTAWPGVSRPTYVGGLGFSLKWNMGWMNDTLKFASLDPVYRKYQHNRITFSILYAFSENFILPLSHDEVVHGKASLINKMPGDLWQEFANLRLLYSYFYGHPGKKLLFMGGEFAQRGEWSQDKSLEWDLLAFEPHQGMQRLISDLNALYKREPALHEVDFSPQGFEWIDCNDADAGVVSFIRRARHSAGSPAETIIVIASFTPVVRETYRVGVPEPGFYREVMNSDAALYGGGNVGNAGGVQAEPVPWMDRPYSLPLRIPPLGVLFLKRQI